MKTNTQHAHILHKIFFQRDSESRLEYNKIKVNKNILRKHKPTYFTKTQSISRTIIYDVLSVYKEEVEEELLPKSLSANVEWAGFMSCTVTSHQGYLTQFNLMSQRCCLSPWLLLYFQHLLLNISFRAHKPPELARLLKWCRSVDFVFPAAAVIYFSFRIS